MYDVAVVGAGPAGAAAALRALQRRPDARVLLLDAAAFPRDKTCGDGIAAPVFDLLDALDVAQGRSLAKAPLAEIKALHGALNESGEEPADHDAFLDRVVELLVVAAA